MVLSGSLPILPLLPEITILSVFHLLAVVKYDGAILRPGKGRVALSSVNRTQDPWYSSPWMTFSPCLWGTGQPLIMLLKGDQVGCNLL